MQNASETMAEQQELRSAKVAVQKLGDQVKLQAQEISTLQQTSFRQNILTNELTEKLGYAKEAEMVASQRVKQMDQQLKSKEGQLSLIQAQLKEKIEFVQEQEQHRVYLNDSSKQVQESLEAEIAQLRGQLTNERQKKDEELQKLGQQLQSKDQFAQQRATAMHQEYVKLEDKHAEQIAQLKREMSELSARLVAYDTDLKTASGKTKVAEDLMNKILKHNQQLELDLQRRQNAETQGEAIQMDLDCEEALTTTAHGDDDQRVIEEAAYHAQIRQRNVELTRESHSLHNKVKTLLKENRDLIAARDMLEAQVRTLAKQLDTAKNNSTEAVRHELEQLRNINHKLHQDITAQQKTGRALATSFSTVQQSEQQKQLEKDNCPTKQRIEELEALVHSQKYAIKKLRGEILELTIQQCMGSEAQARVQKYLAKPAQVRVPGLLSPVRK